MEAQVGPTQAVSFANAQLSWTRGNDYGILQLSPTLKCRVSVLNMGGTANLNAVTDEDWQVIAAKVGEIVAVRGLLDTNGYLRKAFTITEQEVRPDHEAPVPHNINPSTVKQANEIFSRLRGSASEEESDQEVPVPPVARDESLAPVAQEEHVAAAPQVLVQPATPPRSQATASNQAAAAVITPAMQTRLGTKSKTREKPTTNDPLAGQRAKLDQVVTAAVTSNTNLQKQAQLAERLKVLALEIPQLEVAIKTKQAEINDKVGPKKADWDKYKGFEGMLKATTETPTKGTQIAAKKKELEEGSLKDLLAVLRPLQADLDKQSAELHNLQNEAKGKQRDLNQLQTARADLQIRSDELSVKAGLLTTSSNPH